MGDWTIRRADPGEAGDVRAVVIASYQHYIARIGKPPGPMQDDYGARIAAGQAWVLEEAGSIAGVLILEDGPDYFLLDNIAVRPDRQGQGFGRLLLDFAEQQAKRHGWDVITLYTHALMTENIAIYTRRGFVEYDRRREEGFDRVYMRKRLLGG